MKPTLRTAVMTGALLFGANIMLAASSNYIDQWFKAKFGRSSPTEEARLRAEQANTAYREEATLAVKLPQNTWFEDRWRVKYGRSSPIEEARLKALAENTAYREEVKPENAIADNWRENFWKAKFGRSFPVK